MPTPTPTPTPTPEAARVQKLIDAAADRGGGTVPIEPGEHEVSMLTLRTGVTLHLERGSTLVACTDLDRYPRLPEGHNKDRQPFHLIHAQGLDGITIQGDGTIDGRGPAFWDPPLGDATLGARGSFYRAKPRRISPLLEIRDCTNVTLRDFTIRNSPGWTVHLVCCDRGRITGVTVDNSLFGPNTDGFDLNGCRDVHVSNCNLTCGDDAIILKATPDARSCERITVTNCTLATNCAALGIGAEIDHPIRDIAFSNCTVKQAIRIIQIEMWSAGLVENVVINNIVGSTLSGVSLERPIYLDIQSHRRDVDHGDESLGTMRNILISNLACTTRGRIMLTAKDGSTIENVTLRDIHLTYPAKENGHPDLEDATVTVTTGGSSQMSNDNPETRMRNAALILDNVRGLELQNLRTNWPTNTGGGDPPVKYHALWARRTTDSHIDPRHLTASDPNIERFVMHESDIDMPKLD